MDNGRIVGFVLLAIGIGLFIYGYQATESISSSFSKFFQGAPSEKSIWLVVAGVLTAAIGFAQLARRRTA